MPVLHSHVGLTDETYRANRAAQLALLAELDRQIELAIAGGGERYQRRHLDRGRLLARERIELLLDPDSPFLELSALAAWGTEFTVGATVVTGIGVISGVECVLIAHDPTVRGGAMNPYSLRKTLRALEIARVNRLPVVNLVESGGADLPTQADLFVPAGRIFHELTELSGLAIPTVALVFGNSTAGGAYVPGMCDYAVLVDRQAKVAAGHAVGYTGAGTVEFVLDRAGSFWFLEMNTRLQVEHPVTEEVTGLDLVEWQLRIAAGEPLPPEVREATIGGHAIEVRLYAEDVAAGFVPVTGVLHRFAIPPTAGIRVDTGFRDGSQVSPHYDAMLAKVIGHGRTRADAARRLARALRQAQIHGVTTNRDLLVAILREPGFGAGATDTGYLTRHDPAFLAASAAPDAATARAHALAAALARQARHRAEAPVLGTLPSGWRNVFSSPQRVRYTAAGEQREVAYRIRGDRADADVDGIPVHALVHAATPDRVDLEVDGTRRVYRVHQVGAEVYVDASDGSSALSEVPRFGDPEKLAPAGSLLAPMPGLVLRVLAEVGAVVTAGQPLLVLEAMKMEQTVSAPADGVVAELRAKAGEQVSTGQVLVVLEAGG